MPVVAAFGLLSLRVRGAWLVPVLIVLGLAAWVLVFLSGIHPTIAGVALGLALSSRVAGRVRGCHRAVVQHDRAPLFALVAALVIIPAGSPADLSPAFWAVLVALPVGKLVGITLAGVDRDPAALTRSAAVR